MGDDIRIHCNHHNVALIGPPGVGKSSFARLICKGEFSEVVPDDEMPTCEVEIGGETSQIRFVDSFRDLHQAATRAYLNTTSIFLFFFDCSRPETFDILLENWVSVAKPHFGKQPKIFIGTKCDASSLSITDIEDAINSKLNKKQNFRLAEFCSAKTNTNVIEIMEKIKELLERPDQVNSIFPRPPSPSPSPSETTSLSSSSSSSTSRSVADDSPPGPSKPTKSQKDDCCVLI